MATEESRLVVEKEEDKSSGGCLPPCSYADIIRPCLGEFVAVILFVFVGTLSVSTGDSVLIAIAHGATLAALVAAFGHVSGTHVNPAVTLGVWMGGGINWLLAIFYVILQLAGAVLGAAITKGVLDADTYEFIHGGAPALAPDVTVAQGFLAEAVLTFLLVITVLLTAVDSDGANPSAPIAIGFALLVSAAAAGSLTGAALNPCRAFGPTVVANFWENHWIYWLAPAAGGAIAGAVYRVFLGSGQKRFIAKDKEE